MNETRCETVLEHALEPERGRQPPRPVRAAGPKEGVPGVVWVTCLLTICFILLALDSCANRGAELARMRALARGQNTTATIVGRKERGYLNKIDGEFHNTYDVEYEFHIGSDAYRGRHRFDLGPLGISMARLRGDEPYAIGTTIPVVYVPTDPAVHQAGTAEGVKIRSSSGEATLMFGFFALIFGFISIAGLVESLLELRRCGSIRRPRPR